MFRNSSIFGVISLKVNSRFGAELTTRFTLFYFLAYSHTVKIVAKYSSETSVGFQQTTQPYIQKAGAFQI
jgi:hypothetical protein